MRFSTAATSTVIAFLASSFVTDATEYDTNEPRGLRTGGLFRAGRGTPQDEVPTIDLSGIGEELKRPVQISSNGRTVKATLRFDAAEYVGPAFKTMVRVYGGVLPGPTIRIKPGDKLHLTLVNDLREPVGNLANNKFQHPNQTNLHTHGPHISGEDPGDNVFVNIKDNEFQGYTEVTGMNVGPKEFRKYRYEVDGNHMPGTFWYHPHLHGSSALQASIAAGMLIIEDPADYPLPDAMKEMPEVQMIISNLDIGTGVITTPGTGGLRRWSTEAGDRLSNWTEGQGFEITNATFNIGTFPANTNVFLPNFQYKPKVTIEADRWYRFRMCQATVESALVMGFEGGASNCEMKLIAKDGIYVKEGGAYGPRDVSAIFLAAGNRADVAIRCTASDEMKQVARGVEDFDPPPANSNMPTVFSIVVEGSSNAMALPVSYDLPTPCYQADLQGFDKVDDFTMENNTVIFYEGRAEPMGIVRQGRVNPYPLGDSDPAVPYNPNFIASDNIPWVDQFTPYLTKQLGTVQQIHLVVGGIHPHHQHVNPFQLIDLESIALYDDVSAAAKAWYKSGDWHDLFQWPVAFEIFNPPTQVVPTEAYIRYAVNQFSGRMAFHCHRLNHEDLGMIGFFQLEGQEGTLWDGARDVDPTCLLPKLPGNV